MVSAIVFATLLILLPAVVTGQSNEAPALALKDLRGRTVRISDYRGKVVLLNFWATWCPPCRAEMPDLVKWQRQYRGPLHARHFVVNLSLHRLCALGDGTKRPDGLGVQQH
jgi:thiol-disulfide isomerase/thioredoxin